MIEDKKNEIKRIFVSYLYFKKCIKRIYKRVNEERITEREI